VNGDSKLLATGEEREVDSRNIQFGGWANSEPGAVATGSTGLTAQDQCYLLTRQNSTVNGNAT